MTPLRLSLALSLVLAACASDPAPAPPVDDTEADAPEVDVVADDTPAPADRLDLNTATEDELMTVPGVGERMAHEFEEYRPWTSVGQFRREIGKYVDDDAAVLDGYLRHVYVPLTLDGADAETLMQLPGLTQAEAQQLADGQPYASADAFVAAYEGVSSRPDAEAARALLSE